MQYFEQCIDRYVDKPCARTGLLSGVGKNQGDRFCKRQRRSAQLSPVHQPGECRQPRAPSKVRRSSPVEHRVSCLQGNMQSLPKDVVEIIANNMSSNDKVRSLPVPVPSQQVRK